MNNNDYKYIKEYKINSNKDAILVIYKDVNITMYNSLFNVLNRLLENNVKNIIIYFYQMEKYPSVAKHICRLSEIFAKAFRIMIPTIAGLTTIQVQNVNNANTSLCVREGVCHHALTECLNVLHINLLLMI